MSLDQPKLDLSPEVSDEVRKTTCYMCARAPTGCSSLPWSIA